jgi:hypothetical protein
MLMALAVLLFPIPQANAVTAESGKPAATGIVAPKSARPLLPGKNPAASGAEPSSVSDTSLEPPETSHSTDVPSFTLVKRFDPRHPGANLPAHLDLRLPEFPNTSNVETAVPPRPAFQTSAETAAKRRLWYTLVVSSHSAAVFDAWSTRRAISSGQGQEANPLLRPFSHSNVLYVAAQASPALMDFLGRRMMTSQHHWVRRIWWLPQAAGTATSFFSGVHNVRIVH